MAELGIGVLELATAFVRGNSIDMQHQLCPRCKFRITSNKAICTTCGYSLNNARKVSDAPVAAPSQKPMKAAPMPSTSDNSALRKVQANSSQTPSFWRSFFGLDQIAPEKSET